MAEGVGPEVLKHLLSREREMVRLLRRLAEAESPSLDPGTQAGPQAILRLELERLGFVVRAIPGVESGGQLLAIPHARPKRRSIQLMVGHCDTVWEVGTLGAMPVIEKEGRLYGPGTYDMKGGLVNIVFALRALQSMNLRPEVVPIVLVNSDEEIGSSDSMRHIKRLPPGSSRRLARGTDSSRSASSDGLPTRASSRSAERARSSSSRWSSSGCSPSTTPNAESP